MKDTWKYISYEMNLSRTWIIL